MHFYILAAFLSSIEVTGSKKVERNAVSRGNSRSYNICHNIYFMKILKMSTYLVTNSTNYLKQINNKVCNPKNLKNIHRSHFFALFYFTLLDCFLIQRCPIQRRHHLNTGHDSAGIIYAPALTVRELSLHRPWQCGDHLGNGPDSAGITSAPALTVRGSSLHRPWQNFSALSATSQRSSLSCPR